MGVIKVPTAESRMGPGELPNFRAHSNASPEAFGSGVAKATQNLGAVVGEMAGLADKYVQLEEQDEIMRRKKVADDKLDELKLGKLNEKGEREGGYLNGGNITEADYIARSNEIRAEALGGNVSRRMRRQLEPLIDTSHRNFASGLAENKIRKDKEEAVQNWKYSQSRYQEDFNKKMQMGDHAGAREVAARYENDLRLYGGNIYSPQVLEDKIKEGRESLFLQGFKSLSHKDKLSKSGEFLGEQWSDFYGSNTQQLIANDLDTTSKIVGHTQSYEILRSKKYEGNTDKFLADQTHWSEEQKKEFTEIKPLLDVHKKAVQDRENREKASNVVISDNKKN